jgi:hypothetical protein
VYLDEYTMKVDDDIALIEVASAGRSRVVAFYAHADVMDCDAALQHYVLVGEDLEQIRTLHFNISDKVDVLVNLDPVKAYLTGERLCVTLGDMSRLFNDLLGSLMVRSVVPSSISVSWSRSATELLSQLNPIRSQVISSSISTDVDTSDIPRLVGLAYDATEFVPSKALSESVVLAMAFIKSSLQLESEVERIAPYCLVPIAHEWLMTS